MSCVVWVVDLEGETMVEGILESIEIVLCDHSPLLVRAWEREFAAYPSVEVRLGDFFEMEADAYVSPANSFGRMDGGIDLYLSERFPEVERAVQFAIFTRWNGFLPVGQAVIVETGDSMVPYLIAAPTMEIPSDVSHTNHAYQAMAALLSAVRTFNTQQTDKISLIAIPGLGTGIGRIPPEAAAQQMARAYADFLGDLMDYE